MARPKTLFETVLVRLPEGTKAEIRAIIGEGAEVAAFIRAAIEREVARRKRKR